MIRVNKEFLYNHNSFVFLDDILAGKNKLFINPVDEIKVFSLADLKDAFEKIEKLKENYYLAGYIRYEFKELLLGKKAVTDKPFIYFGVFDEFLEVEIDDENIFSPYLEIKPQVDFKEYKRAIKDIKNQIELGNTYQVNYTFSNLIKAGCSLENLYLALRQNQKTHYASFIKNEFDTILSFSPELFFEIEGNKLKTKPMKGTLKKALDEKQNKKNKELLAKDEKNKAENVMIVDLLRNDMGAVSKTSSVNVTSLFDIEEYETLFQMTSTIESELKDNIVFEDIIRALFPCGSITGAPKIKTMEIIDDIETVQRDVYCGAIGFISKEKTVMSVPIRILQKQDEKIIYHTGSGITYPSCEKQEWDECNLKMNFLKFDKEFQILETMLFEKGKVIFEKEHFDRMKNSAKFFGFDFNIEKFDAKAKEDCMVRVLLDKKGSLSYEYLPLVKPKTNKVVISENIADSKNIFLSHKTTYRPWYEVAMGKIKSGEVYDVIFFNEKGQITEGARSNILLEKNNKMYTPCSSCGVLKGVYREHLIREGVCYEKILTLDDLNSADNIYMCNSVRGMLKVDIPSRYNHAGA